MIEETYPSGRVVKNTLSNDGDLQQVQSRRANDTFRNYANGFTYTAAGAVSALHLGNGKWESTQFNSRLQPTQIGLGGSATNTSLLKLNYDYGTTQNNGNVLGQTITVNRAGQSPLVFNQTYTYDELNRLKIAEEKTGTTTNWKQTFTFDRYGNRNFNQSQTTSPTFANPNVTNPTIDTANNRFTTGQGWTYDLAGNVITDAEGRSFNYDSENKQIEAKNSSSTALGTYYFDGDGKRVKKVVPNGETTVFVYDAGGKLVAEYSTIVQPSSNAKIQYLTNDNLGTPRINTDATGNIVSRSDYMPYGEEIIALGGRSSTDKYVTDDVRQGFTGYENDIETGLDFAQARMYANRLGRFHSSDPLLNTGNPAKPKSWNRYVYVSNNPLRFIDPTGLFEWDTTLQDNEKLDKKERERRKKLRDSFTKARTDARAVADKALKDGKITQSKYDKIVKALDSYGNENEKNGVTVGIGTKDGNAGSTLPTFAINEKWNGVTPSAEVKFDEKFLLGGQASVGVVHEGSHVVDAFAFADYYNSNKGYELNDPRNPTQYQTEVNAFNVQSYYFEAMGKSDKDWGVYQTGWSKVDEKQRESNRQDAIDKVVKEKYKLWRGGYDEGWHMSSRTCRPCN